MTRPLHVVLTGSEGTGKTALARALAERYRTICVPEAARIRAETKGEPLNSEDVEWIARRHIEDAEAAASRAPGMLLLDTDLVSTVVYALHYYGGCPDWILREARARRGDLYLLHHPDVPWVADGVRDRGDSRETMHASFVETLASLHARVVEMRGSWSEREGRAVAAIDALLSESQRPPAP